MHDAKSNFYRYVIPLSDHPFSPKQAHPDQKAAAIDVAGSSRGAGASSDFPNNL